VEENKRLIKNGNRFHVDEVFLKIFERIIGNEDYVITLDKIIIQASLCMPALGYPPKERCSPGGYFLIAL
jgi:hypothetical protein